MGSALEAPTVVAGFDDVAVVGVPIEQTEYAVFVQTPFVCEVPRSSRDEHRADIIQTQTPINPGNSGGPLLGDSSSLIGVNSFKAGGENLNFAVSVDEVKRFIARPGNRIAQTPKATKSSGGCEPKELSKFRNKENDATIISFDMFCSGHDQDTGELVVPDDQSMGIFLRVDRNNDGQVDLIIFDFKRRGKWDLSFWDENFEGHWSLVGYHDDGSLTPTRFESYAEFQKRMASR